MMNGIINILHVIQDDIKFSLDVFDQFEKDKRINNRMLLIVDNSRYKCKIPDLSNVIVLYKERDIKRLFQSNEFDVVYFHSLPAHLWKYVKHIPQSKKIIWWAWGYDIYDSFYGASPILNYELLMPKTKEVKKKIENTFIERIRPIAYKLLLRQRYEKLKVSILKRVDFFQPVLQLEYDMIKERYPFFTAEPFYAFSHVEEKLSKVTHKSEKQIIIGNSSSLTNNHMDIFDCLCKIDLHGYNIILPMNYGDSKYREYVKRTFVFNNNNVGVLDKFLPKEEYWDLFDNSMCLINGVLRQQAMGNIFHALSKGTKIFLYKDSIPYKALSSFGFTIFTIESISIDSLSQPMSQSQVVNNKKKEKQFRLLRNEVYDRVINYFTSIY